jgi:hypothetical protein
MRSQPEASWTFSYPRSANHPIRSFDLRSEPAEAPEFDLSEDAGSLSSESVCNRRFIFRSS